MALSKPKLSECFVSWRALAPDIALQITKMRAAEMSVSMRRKEVDVEFSFGAPDDEAVTQEVAWACRSAALLQRDHEFVGRRVLSISELLALPMIA